MRDFISILIIIFLLPYVVAVFINGKGLLMTTGEISDQQITVRTQAGTAPIDMDDYLCQVVACELQEVEQKWYPEFLKAQAVIARTRALKSKKDDVYEEPYLTPSRISRVYNEKQREAIRQAVLETESQVLVSEGNLAEALFFFLSNGSTRSGNEVFPETGISYLQPALCEKDLDNAGLIKEYVFPYQEVIRLCKGSFKNLQNNIKFQDLEIVSKDSYGYVLCIRLGQVEIPGEEFCQLLSLPSSHITLQDYYGKLRIITRGKGHGLGLSQNAANEMAKEGQSYEDILQYFYKNIQIESAKDISENKE